MRVIHKPVFLIFMLLMSGCGKYEKAAEKLEFLEPDTFTCDVVQVKCGDRFMCRFPDMRIETIRLSGISIPGDKQADAKRYSVSILGRGTLVNIEPDQVLRDGNRDIQAYVFVLGGKMLNALLIEKGYAEVAKDEGNVKYKAVFLRIQDKNQHEETGVIEESETEKQPRLR